MRLKGRDYFFWVDFLFEEVKLIAEREAIGFAAPRECKTFADPKECNKFRQIDGKIEKLQKNFYQFDEISVKSR